MLDVHPQDCRIVLSSSPIIYTNLFLTSQFLCVLWPDAVSCRLLVPPPEALFLKSLVIFSSSISLTALIRSALVGGLLLFFQQQNQKQQQLISTPQFCLHSCFDPIMEVKSRIEVISWQDTLPWTGLKRAGVWHGAENARQEITSRWKRFQLIGKEPS